VAPLTACRFSPRLDTASGPTVEAEGLGASVELKDGGLLEADDVVAPVDGLASGGLPKGPDPAGGLPG